ncbi:hypothetical protein CCP2SC5_940007 [Azospirillaceae bacterium]
MFLVAGDHKGGAKAPLIREAIVFWNCLFLSFKPFALFVFIVFIDGLC